MTKKFLPLVSVVCLLACVSITDAAEKPTAPSKGQKLIVGYISSGGRPLVASSIAAGKMTRINYAFFRLKGNAIGDGTPIDAANLAVLTGLRRTTLRSRY